MVKASAYIKDGRLIILGVAQVKAGAVPFSYDAPAPGASDGPVDMGADNGPLEPLLAEAELSIKKKIQRGIVKVGAENLVLRARQGDQNAMAMIIAVRQNARRGSPKARAAFIAIREYIEDHPVSQNCEFGFESKKLVSKALAKQLTEGDPQAYAISVAMNLPHLSQERGVVLLAKGPIIDKTLLTRLSDGFSGREKEQFKSGLNGTLTGSSESALGNVVRLAAELQAARVGRFDKCSKLLQYELGY